MVDWRLDGLDGTGGHLDWTRAGGTDVIPPTTCGRKGFGARFD